MGGTRKWNSGEGQKLQLILQAKDMKESRSLDNVRPAGDYCPPMESPATRANRNSRPTHQPLTRQRLCGARV